MSKNSINGIEFEFIDYMCFDKKSTSKGLLSTLMFLLKFTVFNCHNAFQACAVCPNHLQFNMCHIIVRSLCSK